MFKAILKIANIIRRHAPEDKAVQHLPNDHQKMRETRDQLRLNYILMYQDIVRIIAKVVHALYRKSQKARDAFKVDDWQTDLDTLKEDDEECKSFLESLHRLRLDPTTPTLAVERGRNALHNAAVNNLANDVAALIRSGDYDINAKTKHNWTALSLAAGRGHIRVVHKFIHVPNMQLNSRNDKGETALIIATKKGRVKVVKALVEELVKRKKKLDVEDKAGKTALQYAIEGKNAEIEKIIREGAKMT
jgi:hypothetical protein